MTLSNTDGNPPDLILSNRMESRAIPPRAIPPNLILLNTDGKPPDSILLNRIDSRATPPDARHLNRLGMDGGELARGAHYLSTE